MKQKLKKIIGIFLSIGIGVFIIWWSVKGLTNVQLTDIKNAIVNANYFWIGVAVIIGLLSHFSRAYRWKYLLKPLGFQPKFWNSVFAIFIAYLVTSSSQEVAKYLEPLPSVSMKVFPLKRHLEPL